MNNASRWIVFFIAIGFLLGNSFDFNMNKLYQRDNFTHAILHACKDLKTVGRTYCFDKSNPTYMTIGLYEEPNDYKAYLRIQDDGGGIPIVVLDKKKNVYNELFCKVKTKDKLLEGWVSENLVKYE